MKKYRVVLKMKLGMFVDVEALTQTQAKLDAFKELQKIVSKYGVGHIVEGDVKIIK